MGKGWEEELSDCVALTTTNSIFRSTVLSRYCYCSVEDAKVSG